MSAGSIPDGSFKEIPMPSLQINTGRLSTFVDSLLFPHDEADLRFLRGLAASANTVGVLASGGVTPIGPPKKRVLAQSPVGKRGDFAYTGGVTPIGPPKKLDAFVSGMIRGGKVVVPRWYPDLSAWQVRPIPAHLRAASFVVAGTQFQAIATWIGKDLAPAFDEAAGRLIEAGLGG
jgi:hypothetical protein